MFIQLTSAEEANQQLLIRVEDIVSAKSITLGSVVEKVANRNNVFSQDLIVKESVDEIHKRIRESQNGFLL